MSNFTRHMRQTITYWAPTGEDQYGKTQFAAPSTMKGRWEERAELIRNKKGEEIVSKSRVFVASDIDINGYLFLGESVEASPFAVAGAYEIQQVGRQPDLRAIKTLIVAHL